MNINDIMLQGDAGSGTTEASSKYYNVGKIMRQLLMRVIWGFVVKPFRLIL